MFRKSILFNPAIFVSVIMSFIPLYFPPVDCYSQDANFPPIDIKADKLYAGDEELFLNAVGYSGIRPGKDQFDPIKDEKYGYDLIDLDMKRIKEAGFNAIRTYALLDEKMVELAGKHGLWVVAGIWTDPNIATYNDSQVQNAVNIVKEQAKIYSKYPNVAMLLLINEPNPGRIYSPSTKRYMKLLAEAAKENFPGIPVSFANMPNAVFIDPSPWDVISHNIYAAGFPKFKASIGYRGLVEGVRKTCSGNKPFFISEYGFYAPVPKPNFKEPWIYFYVKDEDEQSNNLLRDQEVLSHLDLAGMTLMLWDDDWRNFGEVSQAHPFLEDPARTKYIHDMFTGEWGGLIEYDSDIKGKPRKAYYELTKANQAILMHPDPEAIYDKEIPVRLYITEVVVKLRLLVDGKVIGEIPRTSKHWAEIRLPVSAEKGSKSVKKHTLRINVYDSKNKIINTISAIFWTGASNILPSIKITEPVKGLPTHKFNIELKDSDGRPIPGAKVTWGLFDVFNWLDYGGEVITNTEGTASFSSPKEGKYLAGAGYEFKSQGFSKRCTDLIFAK